MFFPAGINPSGTNPGFPLGINPGLVEILVHCITVTLLAQAAMSLNFVENQISLTHAAQSIALSFLPPSLALSWLSSSILLSHAAPALVEVNIHDTDACS